MASASFASRRYLCGALAGWAVLRDAGTSVWQPIRHSGELRARRRYRSACCQATRIALIAI